MSSCQYDNLWVWDAVPVSFFGKIIGIITMFSGVLILALPVAIISGRFERVYIKSETLKKE